MRRVPKPPSRDPEAPGGSLLMTLIGERVVLAEIGRHLQQLPRTTTRALKVGERIARAEHPLLDRVHRARRGVAADATGWRVSHHVPCCEPWSRRRSVLGRGCATSKGARPSCDPLRQAVASKQDSDEGFGWLPPTGRAQPPETP